MSNMFCFMSIWLDVAASVPTAYHRDPVGITCPGYHHRHYQPAAPHLFSGSCFYPHTRRTFIIRFFFSEFFLVNHYTIQPYFASSFGLPDDPNLTSLEAFETELSNNPRATAREDSLLHCFSRMEKYIIIKHPFPTPFSHNFRLLPQTTDLILPLSNPLHSTHSTSVIDFFHATSPEWSNITHFDPSRECQPGESFFSTTRELCINAFQHQLFLLQPNVSFQPHPFILTLPLPSPLQTFFNNPDVDLLQCLGLDKETNIMGPRTFLAFLQMYPILLFAGGYTSFRNPGIRNLVIHFREEFCFYLSGFPRVLPPPPTPFHPSLLQEYISDFDDISDSSDTSLEWTSSLSEDDITTHINLEPQRRRRRHH
jgi:hypothetical protein